MTPFFSIITPVFNREDAIKKSISSVLNQTFEDYEMIVINDGSSDKTAENVKFLASKNQTCISLIDYTTNKGVNYARNRGIEKAEGQYLLFLDSDDQLSSTQTLRYIHSLIAENPGYRHYLFRTTDREKDICLPSQIKEFRYEDWVRRKVSGDFAHVVSTSCFSDMPFPEDFRIYETLNWMRIFRKYEKQLYIPITMITRDRNRKDSVTKETRLSSKKAQRTKFDFLERFLEWYAADFRKYGMEKRLYSEVRTAVILGIALGENSRNTKIIQAYIQKKYYRYLFTLLNTSVFKGLATQAIWLRSILNHRKPYRFKTI